MRERTIRAVTRQQVANVLRVGMTAFGCFYALAKDPEAKPLRPLGVKRGDASVVYPLSDMDRFLSRACGVYGEAEREALYSVAFDVSVR